MHVGLYMYTITEVHSAYPEVHNRIINPRSVFLYFGDKDYLLRVHNLKQSKFHYFLHFLD